MKLLNTHFLSQYELLSKTFCLNSLCNGSQYFGIHRVKTEENVRDDFVRIADCFENTLKFKIKVLFFSRNTSLESIKYQLSYEKLLIHMVTFTLK